MSFRTMEVEVERGHIRACGSDVLPEKAHALLTILNSPATPPSPPQESSLSELVGALAGIGRGEHTDLSSNKKHLADFGQ